ncbi:Zn-dependent hydrolase, glyoxylase [Frankia canadensis]|uniref:Zn-dependent hydrolase, glyoxylase n=1 Tax=Frankia canadensis TaxID=1836972 RepID=A0A2I2KKI6_9ACTN|nr:MBL fold metallo-hydrolase [Frankia canadensis]SNQ46181.1 Zn-dependent hydrolase, glyoxylase [Frankia canadensis]SOU53471.1 Zn-dependent hydrolase, glyoxylase [Frankia canadensis]
MTTSELGRIPGPPQQRTGDSPPPASPPATAPPSTALPSAPPTAALPTAAAPAGVRPAQRWRRPLPPVERVRPGLWSLPIPLPFARPSYTLMYVIESLDGPYLIDAGWDWDEAFAALEDGLALIGTSVPEVRGVLVTHAHLDHYGMAARIRAASGAWVSLHPLDDDLLARARHGLADRLSDVLDGAGVPGDIAERLLTAEHLAPHSLPRPDILLEDGDQPDIPGWELRTLWTPGHSPGHVNFWEPAHRLLLSGDHVLPTTAVGTPVPDDLNPDPLGDHLRSLARLRGLDATEVLPAHEHRFTDLEGRLDALETHHRGRLDEVVEGLRAGATTVWELAAFITWHRPLRNLRGVALQNAVTDTIACLTTLATTGTAHVTRGHPDHWHLTTP